MSTTPTPAPSAPLQGPEAIKFIKDHEIPRYLNRLIECLLEVKPANPEELMESFVRTVELCGEDSAEADALRQTMIEAVQEEETSVVERGRDGLLSTNGCCDRTAVLDNYTPTDDFWEVMTKVPFDAPSYIHCPVCRLPINLQTTRKHFYNWHPKLWYTEPLLKEGKEKQYFSTKIKGDPVTIQTVLAEARKFVDRYKRKGVDGEQLQQQGKQRHHVARTSPRSNTNLTDNEIAALHVYTMETPIYRIVNQSLREKDETTNNLWQGFTYYLNEGLTSLPGFQGLVYRGIDVIVPPESYKIGRVVTWVAFSSATSNVRVARDFLKSGQTIPTGTLFILDAIDCKEIQDLSCFPGEDEVIFPINSQFRVSSAVSGGTMTLLEQAMESDLSSVTVYELRELSLSTCRGVIDALTSDEKIGVKHLVDALRPFGNQPFVEAIGEPVLYHALSAAENFPLVTEVLLSAGVNVPYSDSRHCLVPHLLENCHARVPSDDVLRCLDQIVSNGADVNRKGPFSNPGLCIAANRGWTAVVQQLIQHGADLESTGEYGFTPLSFAALHDNPKIIELFLQAGANVHAVDMWGNRALHWAQDRNNQAATEVLQQWQETDSSSSGAPTPPSRNFSLAIDTAPTSSAVRSIGAMKITAEYDNVFFILCVGSCEWDLVPSEYVAGLFALLHGSIACNQLLLRAATFSLTRLMGEPQQAVRQTLSSPLLQQENQAARAEQTKGKYRSRAIKIFKILWTTNENSNVRDAAEMGLKVVGGALTREWMYAMSNSIEVTRSEADNMWKHKPSSVPEPEKNAQGEYTYDWDRVFGCLVSHEQRQRLFAMVNVIHCIDTTKIPLAVWLSIADILDDSVENRLILLIAFAAVKSHYKQLVSLSMKSSADFSHISSVTSASLAGTSTPSRKTKRTATNRYWSNSTTYKDLLQRIELGCALQYQNCVFKDIRQVAHDLWIPFNKSVHANFCNMFHPTPENFDYLANASPVVMNSLCKLALDLGVDDLEQLPSKVEEHRVANNMNYSMAFGQYYFADLYSDENIFVGLLSFFFWAIQSPDQLFPSQGTGDKLYNDYNKKFSSRKRPPTSSHHSKSMLQLDTHFVTQQLHSANRFCRLISLLYLSKKDVPALNDMVRNMSKHDVISDVRLCAQWVLRTKSLEYTADLQELFLVQEQRQVEQLYQDIL